MGKKIGKFPYFCPKCGKEMVLESELGFFLTSKTKYKDEQGNKIKTNYGGQPLCPDCGEVLLSTQYKDRFPNLKK